MLEKVIFVAGTSFSGSTMLDMILANDPGGFSCGQVYNLFYPMKPHQVNPPCDCGAPGCSVWKEIYRAGPGNLYKSIAEQFPEVKFVVDSSKDPCWFKRQEKVARAQGLEVVHVLTWKSPAGLARSFEKRGRGDKFAATYLNYHRFYNAAVGNWVGVNHESLIEDLTTLGMLCHRVGISMFDGKHRFWEKKHHTLFGNNSAKVSLFAQDHPRFEAIRGMRVKIDGAASAPVSEHRNIYQAAPMPSQNLAALSEASRREVETMACGLRSRSIGTLTTAEMVIASELPTAGRAEIAWRCSIDGIRRRAARLKYKQHFDT